MDTVIVNATAAAVTGARHQRSARNGQDAALAWCDGDTAVAVVCDGCSSAASSEVGARLGATLFGGVELFTSNTISFKAEAKYHLIANAGTYNPDGLALTAGIKKYF